MAAFLLRWPFTGFLWQEKKLLFLIVSFDAHSDRDPAPRCLAGRWACGPHVTVSMCPGSPSPAWPWRYSVPCEGWETQRPRQGSGCRMSLLLNVETQPPFQNFRLLTIFSSEREIKIRNFTFFLMEHRDSRNHLIMCWPPTQPAGFIHPSSQRACSQRPSGTRCPMPRWLKTKVQLRSSVQQQVSRPRLDPASPRWASVGPWVPSMLLPPLASGLPRWVCC